MFSALAQVFSELREISSGGIITRISRNLTCARTRKEAVSGHLLHIFCVWGHSRHKQNLRSQNGVEKEFFLERLQKGNGRCIRMSKTTMPDKKRLVSKRNHRQEMRGLKENGEIRPKYVSALEEFSRLTLYIVVLL